MGQQVSTEDLEPKHLDQIQNGTSKGHGGALNQPLQPECTPIPSALRVTLSKIPLGSKFISLSFARFGHEYESLDWKSKTLMREGGAAIPVHDGETQKTIVVKLRANTKYAVKWAYLLPDGSGWSQRSQPFVCQTKPSNTRPKPPILMSAPGGLKVKFPDLPVGIRFVTVWIAKEGEKYLVFDYTTRKCVEDNGHAIPLEELDTYLNVNLEPDSTYYVKYSVGENNLWSKSSYASRGKTGSAPRGWRHWYKAENYTLMSKEPVLMGNNEISDLKTPESADVLDEFEEISESRPGSLVTKSNDLSNTETLQEPEENAELEYKIWKTHSRLEYSTAPNNRILNPKHIIDKDCESGFIVDLSKMCPHLELITVQQLLLKFVIAKSKREADRCLERFFSEMIFPSIKVQNATLKRLLALRKKHRSDIEREVKDEIKKTAKQAFVNARLFLDESDDFQRATIYFLDYDCKGGHHCDVASMNSEEVYRKLQSYSQDDLARANRFRKKILEEWARPDLMDHFPGLKRDDFNVVICGKSGHGKSSLINLIGMHVGKSFNAKTDILECTKEASKYTMCPDFQVWDVAGYATVNAPEGRDGEIYIRNYSLTYFDLVVIVMSERETSFASILHQLLVAKGTSVLVVRTKVDLDVKSELIFDPDQNRDEILDMIRANIKLQIGARSKHIFLCAAIAPYFDTSKLCNSMIEHFVEFKFPHVDKDELQKMEESCNKGMTDAIMIKRFNLTVRQMQCFRSILALKVQLRLIGISISLSLSNTKQMDLIDSGDIQDDGFDDEDLLSKYYIADGDEEEEESKNSKFDAQIEFNAFDCFIDDNEEDRVFAIMQAELEDKLRPPYNDDIEKLFEETREQLIGGLTFQRRQAEIDQLFELKRKDIDEFLKHKDALRAQITKDIEEKFQIDISEIDDILKDTREEAKSMIKTELERQLFEEEKQRLEEEEARLQWLLHDEAIVKRAYIFALKYNCIQFAVDLVLDIKESELNNILRTVFAAQLKSPLARSRIATELGVTNITMKLALSYFQSKKDYFMKMWRFPLPTNIDEWRKYKRICVVGASGMGKSTFVRSLLRQVGDPDHNVCWGKAFKNIDVKVGVIETTKEPQHYPISKDFILTDFPGAGTVNTKEGLRGEDYVRNFYILHHNVIIIMSSFRFHELGIEIAKICHANDVKFLFIRTKFDVDVQDEYRRLGGGISDMITFSKQVRDKIKTDFKASLGEIQAPLYFIDGRRLTIYHFPKLVERIKNFVHHAEDLKAIQLKECDFEHEKPESIFFDIIASKGKEFAQAAKIFQDAGSDLYDVANLTNDDFNSMDLGLTEIPIRKEIQRLISSHPKLQSSERHIQNPTEPFDDAYAKQAIRSVMAKTFTSSNKLDMVVDTIFQFIAAYEFIRQWKQEDVAKKIEQFGPAFTQFVEPLRIDGQTLLNTSNQDLLTFITKFGIKPNQLLQKNFCRRLDTLRGVYEKPPEKEPQLDESSIEDERKQPKMDPKRKLGVMLSVFRDRDRVKALEEASDFEEALQMKGYEIYASKRRGSPQNLPISTTSEDFYEFLQEFKTKYQDIDGAFIMLVGHGYVDNEISESPPMIEMEDKVSVNIIRAIRDLSGTTFPVILCVAACRVFSNSDSLKSKFQLPMWDIPEQIFLSWASSLGKTAADHEFVTEWRRTILDNFSKQNIVGCACYIKSKCGGKYADGFESDFVCRNGVWIS